MHIEVAVSAAEIPEGWDGYAGGHPHAAIFHARIWQVVLTTCYPYRFFGVYAINTEGEIVGVLPVYLVASKLTGKRMVSAPFSYICDPLADDEAIGGALLEKAKEISRENGASYYELKCRFADPVAEKSFVESGQFETYLLD
ncbi:MAG: hypothetical protein WBP29_06465, partial [Candidatus Zixiibacteriota bacterium]